MSWQIHVSGFHNYLKLERSLAFNSVEAYVHDVVKLNQFLATNDQKIAAQDVTMTQIQEFLTFIAEMGLSEYSQTRILSGIRAFYKYLYVENVINADPTEFVQSPKIGRKLPDVLHVEEIDMILNSIDVSTPEGFRNKAMIEVLYSSGLRVSELVDLKITNIYKEIGFLKVVGKGNKERMVPIGEEALNFMLTYINDVRVHAPIKPKCGNIVFLNRRGNSLTRVMIFLIIKKIVDQTTVDKNVSPHTFRHSFATHLIEGGADLRAVQEMLGHESITTTEIYTHLDNNYLKTVIKEYHPRSKWKPIERQ